MKELIAAAQAAGRGVPLVIQELLLALEARIAALEAPPTKRF